MADLNLNNHANSPPGPTPPYTPPSPSYIQAEPSQRPLTLNAGPVSSYYRFLSTKNPTASSSTEPTHFSFFPLSLPLKLNLHCLSDLSAPCHKMAVTPLLPSPAHSFVLSFYDSTAAFTAPRTREGYKAKPKRTPWLSSGTQRKGKI